MAVDFLSTQHTALALSVQCVYYANAARTSKKLICGVSRLCAHQMTYAEVLLLEAISHSHPRPSTSHADATPLNIQS
jgi:hypothetical protein